MILRERASESSAESHMGVSASVCSRRMCVTILTVGSLYISAMDKGFWIVPNAALRSGGAVDNEWEMAVRCVDIRMVRALVLFRIC
jgi:hypothetical protein